MNINAKISVFRNYLNTVPALNISIFQFYENIVCCDYVNEVNKVRSITDKKQRDAIKSTLPAFTISGTFTQRGNDYLIQHSGFIAIDIDANDNPNITDWAGLRDTLGTWNEILMAALSVSGRGVFCIIPLSYPHKHKAQFEALEKDFAALGLVIDKACKDVSRLRSITNDPQATWNPQAQPYKKVIIEQEIKHTQSKESPELTKLIDWVERKHGSFTKGNRNNFVTQLAGSAHRFNISQSEVEQYCKGLTQTDFTEREILSTIKTIYSNSHWRAKAIV